MQLILELSFGKLNGVQIAIPEGESVTIGRSEQADYSFFEHGQMSRLHFEVSFDEKGGTIRDLESTSGTWLNDERIVTAVLNENDCIDAGGVRFFVHLVPDLPGHIEKPFQPSDESATQQNVSTVPPKAGFEPNRRTLSECSEGRGFVTRSVREVGADIPTLSKEAETLVSHELSLPQYIAILNENGLYQDAILFLGQALCRRDSIVWGRDCLRISSSTLTRRDAEVLEIIRSWIEQPKDKHLEDAMTAAAALDFKTPAAWLAYGMYLSKGVIPIESEEEPELELPLTLGGHAVSGAVLLAAQAQGDDRVCACQKYIDIGLSLGTQNQV